MIPPSSMILIAGLAICLLVVSAVCAVLVRLVRARAANGGPAGLKNKGAPLEDLDSESILFLVKHPALRRTFVRELRRERRKVLRAYLRSLRSEFSLTCAALRAAMVESPEDRPDLAQAVFKQQVLFRIGLLRAECSMILEAMGLAVVDFDGVIDSLGLIRLRVARLYVDIQPQES